MKLFWNVNSEFFFHLNSESMMHEMQQQQQRQQGRRKIDRKWLKNGSNLKQLLNDYKYKTFFFISPIFSFGFQTNKKILLFVHFFQVKFREKKAKIVQKKTTENIQFQTLSKVVLRIMLIQNIQFTNSYQITFTHTHSHTNKQQMYQKSQIIRNKKKQIHLKY